VPELPGVEVFVEALREHCVDKAHSRETRGTGLGLAIVKHMTEKMGGGLSVESRLRKGSTFTLQFPAATTTETKS